LITIPFDLYNSGYEKLTFFQVAYESNNIAFISRKEFESRQNTHLTGGAAPSSISTPHGNVMTGGSAPEIYNYDIFEQREIFYLATPEGLAKPYIKNTYKVVNELFKFKGSSFVERDALKEVLENKYDQCEKYAKDNKLSLKNKDDVLKVLQFSESID